ncbi:MAG TPA: serine hydrolase [Candidatus Dormibacteraeota bacterium]|nr:serine hydrolase [Candidatus Dormibacteraeota bacterium]
MIRISAGIAGLLLIAAPAAIAQAQPTKPAAPQAQPVAAEAAVLPAHALESADLEAFFDGIIPMQLERSDVAGAVVLVMKDGQTLLRKGYGYSDAEKKTAVDPAATAFRLASISKLFTWVSVMQLVEQNKLDLDADVNTYLDFQIHPAFDKPVTLRNLMTHTAGFEEVVRDLLFTSEKSKVSLRQFLIDNQPRRLFPPGVIPGYSNYGVGLGGYIVERVSGQPFEQYVHDHIFAPLGMTHSGFEQPLPSSVTPSNGYRATDGKPVGFEIFLPAPAGGVSSSAADMSRFALALLNGGELDGKRILQPETLAAMWTPQFRANDALPPICMGFYESWRNGLHFIGHDGDLLAFHSRFLLEPQKKLVLFVSYNSRGSESKVRSELLRSFADRYFPSAAKQTFITLSTGEAKEYAGAFISTRRADSTKLAALNLGQSVAAVDKDGVLTIDTSKDLRGHTYKWKPIAKDLWQQVDDQGKLFFIRDANGRIVRAAGDFPGGQWQRVPWWENAKPVSVLLGCCLVILMLAGLAALSRFLRRLIFRKRPPSQPQPGTAYLTAGPLLASIAWLLLAAILFAISAYFDSDSAIAPTRAFDKYFVVQNIVAVFAIFFSAWAVFSAIAAWLRHLRLITRVKFSIVAIACLYLVYFSLHYEILGPAHRY